MYIIKLCNYAYCYLRCIHIPVPKRGAKHSDLKQCQNHCKGELWKKGKIYQKVIKNSTLVYTTRGMNLNHKAELSHSWAWFSCFVLHKEYTDSLENRQRTPKEKISHKINHTMKNLKNKMRVMRTHLQKDYY